MIRLTIPSITEAEIEAAAEVLRSGFLVQGQLVARFEQAVAEQVGTEHAVAVSSGTAALHLALLAQGVGPGDLVVVTAYSWIATANVVELCGATPVFVDVEAETSNMDPARLWETLDRLIADRDQAPRVKAILPVHTFGQVANMPAIMELAKRCRIPVIEDAACALGAAWDGKQAGSWGRFGCFSFHPRKNITTGEGGMITTDDGALSRRLRALRNHGQDPAASPADFILPGFNYRLTEFQAALGLTQLERLERLVGRRRRQAATYDRLLAGSSLRTPCVADSSQPVYQSYVVRLPASAAKRRDQLIADLRAAGIEATVGTCHMPLATYYRDRYGFRRGDFPATDGVSESSVTLPLYDSMTVEEQKCVARQVLQFLADS